MNWDQLELSQQISQKPFRDFDLFSYGADLLHQPGSLALIDDSGNYIFATSPLLAFEVTRSGWNVKTEKFQWQNSQNIASDYNDALSWLERQTSDGRLYGGLAYEAYHLFEKLPASQLEDGYELPLMLFSLYQEVHFVQIKEKIITKTISQLNWNNKELAPFALSYQASGFKDHPWQELTSTDHGPSQMWLNRQSYLHKVEQVQQAILHGEIYQGNFTHLFRKSKTMNSWKQFCQLFSANPAGYYMFWNLGDVEICCTSPELFVQLKEGTLTTQPIKGTLSRKFQTSQVLMKSEKDAAELSMIVDLFRNDLNRICDPNSVKVTAHKSVITLKNVYHMYSEIVGKLHKDTTSWEILAALFPSGSITGCPKIRAIEILQDLEEVQRSFYTGSLGWVSKTSVNLNVAIRTLFFVKNWVYFHVGGGIVFDSEPDKELQETFDKALPFFKMNETWN
ncbi:MAG: anthranilate synthase component I family protein [Bdellovibrionales bacterium]|nr:anthranilate synthase component I family protein [Bdellovibrionales bacterium]